MISTREEDDELSDPQRNGACHGQNRRRPIRRNSSRPPESSASMTAEERMLSSGACGVVCTIKTKPGSGIAFEIGSKLAFRMTRSHKPRPERRRAMTRWPDINASLFVVKTIAAAMLALYIAMSIGLERPYWAMATVYIVSQALTGSLRSKAVFRLTGMLIGATVTVVLVPNLDDAPELLSAALALWTGRCPYLAPLDRTPRSYLSCSLATPPR
jgi:hypothetical protein